MKIFVTSVGSFLLGIAASALAAYLVWQEYYPNSTEVWTASSELTLGNGATIPGGTEFIVDKYMPEGFVRLSLYVNVEGEPLQRFRKRTESARLLKIPYWVDP